MTAVLEDLLAQVERSGRPCLAVSPHLDDAVLSAGGWLHTVAGRCQVLVATVFSEAAGPPHGWMARRFSRGNGHADPQELFTARRAEDREVLAELGLRAIHLGRPDAVFRRTTVRLPAALDSWSEGRWSAGRWSGRTWSRPSYPTLRFDAFRGRVAKADGPLQAAVVGDVVDLIEKFDPALVLGPLGIGRHVDHLIVRDAVRSAVARSGQVVGYVSDQPYALGAGPDREFVRALDLAPHEWLGGRQRAVDAALGYRSQIPVLYPSGSIPVTPEFLWLTKPASARQHP